MKRSRALLAVAPLGMALYGFLIFGPTGRDDSYITYWVAKVIADRGAVLNYNAERIEQSSTALFSFLIAWGHRLSGIDVPTVGTHLSLLFGMATVVAGAMLARAASERLTVVVAVLLATSPVLAYWSFSGMETTLDAFLCVSVVLLTRAVLRARRLGPWLAPAACLLLAYVTTRPEAALVTGSFLACVLLFLSLPAAKGLTSDFAQSRRRLFLLMGMAATIALSVGLTRLRYSGYFFPLPVYAKSPRWHSPLFGLVYVVVHGLILPTLVLYVLAFREGWSIAKTGLAKATAPIALEHVLVAAFLFVRFGFVVAAGGDWMEAGRFLVPCTPFLVILAAAWVLRTRPHALRTATIVSIGLSCVGTLPILAVPGLKGTGMPIWRRTETAVAADTIRPWSERYNRARHDDVRFLEQIFPLLRAELAQSPDGTLRLFSGQAGLWMYYVMGELGDRVRFVDAYGLTTTDLFGCAKSGKLKTSAAGLVPVDLWRIRSSHPWDTIERCEVRADVIVDVDFARNKEVLESRCRRAGYRLALYVESPLKPAPLPRYGCVRPSHATIDKDESVR